MQSIHRPCTAVCFLEFVKIVYKQNINLNKPKHNGVGLGKTVTFVQWKIDNSQKKPMSEDRLQLLVLVNKTIFHSKYKKNAMFEFQSEFPFWIFYSVES